MRESEQGIRSQGQGERARKTLHIRSLLQRGTREIDKAIAIYEQWKQTYPRDTVPWDNLALGY